MSFGNWLESSSWGPGPRAARFLQLRTEFAGNWPDSTAPEKACKVEELLAGSESNPPRWEALLAAETLIVQVMPTEALRLKNASLREELISLAGASASSSYLARLSDISNCSENALHSETVELIGAVQRMRTLRQGFNLIRTSVTLLATFLAIMFCVIIVTYFVLETRAGAKPTGLFATTILVLSGMLGGCISALSRLHSINWTGEMAVGVESFSHLFWSLVLSFLNSIILGAVFGVLLYLAFMGHLVAGALFPEFKREPSVIPTFHQFFERGPQTHGDFAKAIVWCFLAGFSERLVPDFLGTLSGELKLKR